MKIITAQAPATVANIIVGFDTLALAIDNLYDEVTYIQHDSQWEIDGIINGDNLPLDPLKNVSTIAMEAMRQDLNKDVYGKITINKGYRAGSGLGSSAASAVAALWAYNAEMDFPLSQREIIPYAMQSEAYVSGKAIADNVAASALGGIVLIRSDVDYDFISLPVPDLYIGCLLPNVEILTRESRAILPTDIPMEITVQQGANLAGFISALYRNDIDLLRRTLVDEMIEKYRARLIPNYYEAKELAMENDALCFGIGGSGPAVFYFTENEEQGRQIEKEIINMWNSNNIQVTASLGKINQRGVHQVNAN